MSKLYILYFISILVAAFISGVIAYHVRHYRTVPGARTYMWMSLCICSISIFEGLSMLSPTQYWALFCFNLRYIGLSIGPVLWLIFVLQYTEKSYLVTKSRVIFLLILPVITQVLIWTNNWHGLWVQRNADFYQIGSFFVVDTFKRISGPWMQVHFFYSYALAFAGLFMLTIIAARLVEKDRMQILSIIAGTVVMIIGSLYPSFNLVPSNAFNPLTLSLAVGSLFFAWGIFRHGFLERAPVVREGKQVSLLLVFLFFILTGAIVVSGYYYYHQFEESYRTEVERKLTAVVNLKVEEIVQWYTERMGDAAVLHNNPVFIELTKAVVNERFNNDARRKMQHWLRKIQTAYHYKNIIMLDISQKLRISTADVDDKEYEVLRLQIRNLPSWDKISFLDFQLAASGDYVYLGLFVPIVDNGRKLGFVVFLVDPATFLYPMLQRWPTTSKTGETLLVRREGKDVLYLNELKFQKNTAMTLRLPLKQDTLPAVSAVQGKEGIVEGIDYRGEDVIAGLKAVPGSPWFMIAKIDVAEILEPVKRRFWLMFLSVVVLTIGSGITVWLIWQWQSGIFYRKELESAHALQLSKNFLDSIIEHSPHSMWISDERGTLIRLNEACRKLLNVRDDEVIGKYNLFTDNILEQRGFLPLVERVFEKRETVNFTLLYESARLKNVPLKQPISLILEVTISAVADKGKVTNAIVQHVDVTERVHAEKALQESERQLREAQAMAHLGFWKWDVKTGAVEWSDEVFKIFGLNPKEFTPHIDSIMALSPWPGDHERNRELIRRTMENQAPGSYDQRFLRPDKSIGYYYSTFQGIYDADGNLISIVGTVLDITKRKQAEEKIRLLNAELEQKVLERTAELTVKTAELERINKIFVNRELRMRELKAKIAELEKAYLTKV